VYIQESKLETKSFEELLATYHKKYDEAFENYGVHDEDDELLGSACDSARMIYLSAALELATTKAQCSVLLENLMPRNVELYEKISQKMNTLTA
jgi:hypothetical protein